MNRKLITLGRLIRAGAKNLFRNAWLSIAAIAVMTVALTIILLAVVLNITARNAIAELSKNLKVSIYLEIGVTEEERSGLEDAIRSNPYTDQITYVSQEEAQRRFTENFQNDQELLEGLALVGGNTLPASYEVSVTDLNRLQDIEEIAKQEQYDEIVESITLGRTDARRTIDRAADAQKFIVNASIFAASLFGAVSVLIIFNTIRMAIFTRSDEIRIMKLIGATPGYIRGPFIVESMLYGIIAGCVANAAVYAVILSLGSKVATQAEFQQTYTFFIQPSVAVGMLVASILAGTLIGVLSSSIAMNRYLRLKHW